jgi:hypothetical protein
VSESPESAVAAFVASVEAEHAVAELAMKSAPSTLAFEPSYHGHGCYVARWYLTPPQGPGKPIESTVVRMSHYGSPTKAYVATIYRTVYTPAEPGEFTGELYSPMAGRRVVVQSAARYSAKAHKAFAEATVAAIRDGQHPGAEAFFDVTRSAT